MQNVRDTLETENINALTFLKNRQLAKLSPTTQVFWFFHTAVPYKCNSNKAKVSHWFWNFPRVWRSSGLVCIQAGRQMFDDLFKNRTQREANSEGFSQLGKKPWLLEVPGES